VSRGVVSRTSARGLVLALALFAVIAGSAARIDGLNRKLFWQDEAFSMLRITGHVESDLYGLFDGSVRSPGSMLAIERLAPDRGIGATLASLSEEPQRGPLYYALARAWAGVFGDGVARLRAFSALLGIAGIVFAFFLGRRIAGGDVGGAMLAALVALAPVDVQFSGQVREYVAIADAALATAWLLLRAFERGTALRWIAYAASMLVGLFVSPLFLTMVAAHFVAACVVARRSRVQFLSWCAAAGVPCLVFAPWFVQSLAAAPAHARDVSWLLGTYAPKALVTKWIFNIGAVFFDAEVARVAFAVALAPVLALVGLAIANALRGGDALRRALALAMTFAAVALVIGVDVVRHAHYEAVTRYQMTTWVGIEVLVAMLLAGWVGSERRILRWAGVASFAFLIACGAFCAVFDRSYALWWDDNEHIDERRVAATIASSGLPAFVIATDNDGTGEYALVLARYLPPDTKLLLYHGRLPALPAFAGNVYAFVPEAAPLAKLERQRSGRVQNVSPAIGLAIPDLRSSADGAEADAARADNTLWLVR
jgi:uncharacterized membrane protein